MSGSRLSQSGQDRHTAGEKYAALFPRYAHTYKKPVLFAHGWGGTSQSLLSGLQIFDLIPERAGNPVFAGDFGGTSTFGAEVARTSISAMDTWVKNPLNSQPADRESKVICFGGSMGGQNMISWAGINPTLVEGLVFVIAVPDVERSRAENINGTQAAIESAHGDNAGWQAARPVSNPIEVAPGLGVHNIPTLWLYSTNDPYYTLEEVEEITDLLGSNCTAVSMGAIGHAFPTDLVICKQVADFIADL